MDIFINLQLTENGRFLWPFPGNFHKYQLKSIGTADRIDQNRNELVQLFLNTV